MSKEKIDITESFSYFPNEPVGSTLIGQYYKTTDEKYVLLQLKLNSPCSQDLEDYILFLKDQGGKSKLLKNVSPKLQSVNRSSQIFVFRQHEYTLSSMLKKVTENRSVQSQFLEIISILKLVVAQYILFFEKEKVLPSHNCLEDTNILFLNEQGLDEVFFRDMWQSPNLLKFYLDKHEQRKKEEEVNNQIFLGEIAPELKESIIRNSPEGSPQADMFSFGTLLKKMLIRICWSILSNEQKQALDGIISMMIENDSSKRISWSNLENQFSEMTQLPPSSQGFSEAQAQGQYEYIPREQPFQESQQFQSSSPKFQQFSEQQEQQRKQQTQFEQKPFQPPPNSQFRWFQQTNLLNVNESIQNYVLNLEKKKDEINMGLQQQNLSNYKDVVQEAEEALQNRNFALALKELFFFMSNDIKFISYNFNLPQFYFLLTQLIAISSKLMVEANSCINKIQLPFIKDSPLPSSLQADQKEFKALEQKYLPNLQKDLQTVMEESFETGDINRLYIQKAFSTPNYILPMDKLPILLQNLSQEVKQQLINQNNKNNSYLKGLSFRLNKLHQGCQNLWNKEYNTYFNFDYFFEKLVHFNEIGW